MDDGMFTDKKRQLDEEREQLLSEMNAVGEKLALVDLELGAIAAYHDFKAQATRSPERRVSSTSDGGKVTRDAVVRAIAEAGENGLGRADILHALGVKGDKSGEAAVDNRLRGLKQAGQVLHQGRVYRVEQQN